MQGRLSGLDSAFLSMETETAHMHVTAVITLRLEGGDPLAFHSRFRDLIRARLGELPPLRQQLAHAPLDLDHPTWVEADEVDLDFHVRRAALPAPGSQAELESEVARIAAQPLDRSRPLWEMWLLEGLEQDRLALVTKVHHAAIDGVAGAGLMATLFDDDPKAPLEIAPKDRRFEDEAESAPAGLTAALARLSTRPALLAAEFARTGFGVARAALALRRRGRRPALPFTAPPTPFNTAITPHRSVALARVELDGLRRARRILGVKLNDLVLAACTQSLRHYLTRRGELPEEPLIATIPVAVDDAADRMRGNGVSAMFARLPVQLDDPMAQLRDVSHATRAAKQAYRSVGPKLLARWAEWVPPIVLAKASDAYSSLGLADQHGPVHSVIVSNVMGPPFELYCAGLAVDACFPLGPVYDGGALNLTVLSYAGQLHLGAIGCPDAVPDIEELAQGFCKAVEQLEAAAQQRLRTHQRSDAARTERRPPPRERKPRTRTEPSRARGGGQAPGA